MYSVIKQENNGVKLGKNTFRMFVSENAILSWESWHTTITPDANKNSCPLRGQYRLQFGRSKACVVLYS